MFHGLGFRVDDLEFKVDVLSLDLGFRVYVYGLELTLADFPSII